MNTEVFDFEEAVSTFMGKKEVVINVVESFLPKVERQIKILKEALNRKDYETLRSEAHGLKGGSWNLQATRLGNRAFELEKAATDKEADLCAVNLMSVEDAFEEFMRAARSILLSEKKGTGHNRKDHAGHICG